MDCVCHFQEDFTQGLLFYDQAIHIYIDELGCNHPVTEAAMNNKQLAEITVK